MKQLGNLGWYSLKTGTTVDFNQLKKNFENQQLKIMNIKEPSEANLFRKACSSIELETSEGTVKTVKMADTKAYVSRRLILETEKGKRALGVLRFSKRNKELSFRKAGRLEHKYQVEVQYYIDDNKGKIDDSHLRQVIRDYFENKAEGVKLRSGLYFIETSNLQKITALSTALSDIEGCKIFTSSLEDSEEQREMIQLFLEEQFNLELEETYDLWSSAMNKDREKILARDIKAIKDSVKTLENTLAKVACFTNKQFRTECLQDLNELRVGIYKYEKSLEEI